MSIRNPEKVVVIVGAAGGIGRPSVKRLVSRGYHVLAWDHNQSKLEELHAEMNGSVHLETVSIDMTDGPAVKQELMTIKERFGKIEGIVICAAVHSTYPVEFIPDAEIDRAITVNLTAPIKLIRNVIPMMKDGGRIIAISSIAAGIGIPMSSMYSSTKAGLELFFESLSVEMASRNIKCSVIQPGNVNTGFNETGNNFAAAGNAAVDRNYRKVLERIHSRYGMPPDEVAKVIERALIEPSPKVCYIVGINALKAYWAKRLLGRDLALRVMRGFFGIEG